MQIIFGIAIFIIIVTLILYKVNNQFEKKEFIILLVIILITSIAYISYENKQEEFFPNMFKEKYEKEKNITINELTSELQNNKVVSSKTKFIYKFTYIISKENKEFLCTVSNVEINKIEDSYIFKNFKDLKEECYQR
ncbi:hypothetical protein [Arcobacter sp. s6]|jgi:uncharacterized membrane protein|uniref:hypothetical protein n=1 Tax=Arcobacter sp. s6 TaxID=3230363 RepID=UPI0034A0072B